MTTMRASALARAPVSGPALFARYAYAPNALGYCGPNDPSALLESAALGGPTDISRIWLVSSTERGPIWS